MKYKIYRQILMATFLTITTQMGHTQGIHANLRTQSPTVRTHQLPKGFNQLERLNQDKKLLNSKNLYQKPNQEKNKNQMSANKLLMIGGGADTGGGNLSAHYPLTYEQVSGIVFGSKEVIPYILRSLEIEALYISVPNILLKKLFSGSYTIYQALQDAQFNLKNEGYCYDSAGNKVHASAVNSPKLCFSAEGLIANVSGQDATKKILPLIIHELSHMVGFSEQEAVQLQKGLEYVLPINIYDIISNLSGNFNDKLYFFYPRVGELNDELPALGLLKSCRIISSLDIEIGEWISQTRQSGVNVVSIEELKHLASIKMKMGNLGTLCDKDFSDEQVQKVFKGKKEMSMVEYNQNFPNSIIVYPYMDYSSLITNGTIRHIGFQDFVTAQKEVGDILKELEILIEIRTSQKQFGAIIGN